MKRAGYADAGYPDAGYPDGCLVQLMVIALLAVGSALIFASDLRGGSDLYFKAFRDVNPIWVSYPWFKYNLICWRSGLFPLWNPYNACGTPLLAGYQSAVFSFLLWPVMLYPLSTIAVPYLLARLILAGWGCFMFARKLGCSLNGSVMAGVSFALSGYLIQYVNDQHLVIDLFLPFGLIIVQNLVDPAARARMHDLLGCILVTTLIVLGGQPGAAIFTLALISGYGLFLIGVNRTGRAGGLFLICLGMLPGLLMSSILLLPFLEYIPQAWNYHPTGYGTQHLRLGELVTLIAPGFFGKIPEANTRLMIGRLIPYMGAVPLALALIAMSKLRRLSPAGSFFAVVAVVCLGVSYGLPGFGMIGQIPGLDRLSYFKYLQPLLTISVSLLAGHGLTLMEERAVAPKNILTVAAGLILLPIGFAMWRLDWFFPFVLQYWRAIWETNREMILAVSWVAAVLVPFSVLGSLLGRGRAGQAGGGVLMVLLAYAGLYGDSRVNEPFLFQNMEKWSVPGMSAVAGAGWQARVAASPEVFVPNQGLLGLVNDVGTNDALIPARYVMLMHRINGYRSEEEARSDFLLYHSLRLKPESFNNPLAPLLGLSQLLTKYPVPENTLLTMLDKADVPARIRGQVGPATFSINGDARRVFYEHPPARVVFPREYNPPAEFDIGMDSRVYDRPGDGVWFMALTKGDTAPEGQAPADVLPILARYIDPKRRRDEQRYLKIAPAWPEEKMSLSLITLPGNDAQNDWAGWDARQEPESTTLIDGIRIYSQKDALPRAFLCPQWQAAGSAEQSLSMLERVKDLRKTAVVEGIAGHEEVSDLDKENSDALQMVDYAGQWAELNLEARGERLLVLSDNYFPGWRAFLDGEEVKILPADLAFRGVLIPPGYHRLLFIYAPWSFRMGLWAAVSAYGALFIFLLVAGIEDLFAKGRGLPTARFSGSSEI